jgi:hypothetical protein
VVNIISDTSLAMRWVTPASVIQQGVDAYSASVDSECFTNEQRGQKQSFTIPSNGTLEIVAAHLGMSVCVNVYLRQCGDSAVCGYKLGVS